MTLPGNRHPMARPEYDAGAVPADVPMERMMLVLRPDAAQQQALEALLAGERFEQRHAQRIIGKQTQRRSFDTAV